MNRFIMDAWSIQDKTPNKQLCMRKLGVFVLVYLVSCALLHFYVLSRFNLTGYPSMDEVWKPVLNRFIVFSSIYVILDFFCFSRIIHPLKYIFIFFLISGALVSINQALITQRRMYCTHHKYSPTLGWEMAMGLKANGGFETKKKDGSFRVLIFGDSVILGPGVSRDENFVSVLKRMLEKKYPNMDIEVINCGVMGYNLVQIREIIREQGWELEPDRVIVVKHFKAPIEGLSPVDPRPKPWLRPVFSLLYESMVFHERLQFKYYAYANLFRMKLGRIIFPGHNVLVITDFIITEEQFLSSVKSILNENKRRNIKTLLVNLPGRSMDGRVIEYADEYNAYYCISRDFYDDKCYLDKWIHLSSKGHRRLAREVYDYLITTDFMNAE